ncbi:hypothetical protein KL86DES1_20714 [uncultured Desulfovibrio sp.]|uniref:Uncharacterized protein n=1 Tax=uncultured Desulfovibrio sp. TaxID=167968 RepID=A0A212L4T5_9BACT|nr:hypothetical protein KL86DES1_20714 [uncultured Desulfovibrio sp.]VZH33615.1 conserved protein of unknown function [Desulfovibrio sp. 86]
MCNSALKRIYFLNTPAKSQNNMHTPLFNILKLSILHNLLYKWMKSYIFAFYTHI